MTGNARKAPTACWRISICRAAVDLTQEKRKTRDTYGQMTFGQSRPGPTPCGTRRAACRLTGASTSKPSRPTATGLGHTYFNFELLQDRHCPIFDRAYSALLDDLNERGLLKDTLVVAMGDLDVPEDQ